MPAGEVEGVANATARAVAPSPVDAGRPPPRRGRGEDGETRSQPLRRKTARNQHNARAALNWL